jgi:dipeptidyl aminopeptidase/acylaminoacyl peptidase
MSTVEIAVGSAAAVSGEFELPGGAPRAVVVMLHGGPGGTRVGPGNLFVELERRLLVCGFATLRFDFRGTDAVGNSFAEARLSTMKADLEAVLDWIGRRLDVPVVLLGESLGATIALMLVRPSAERLVLLWPAVDLRETSFASLMTTEALRELDEGGFIQDGGTRISRSFIEECMTLNLWPKIALLKGKVLIVHGEQDQDVPVIQSNRLANALGDQATLVRIPGARHGAKEPEEQAVVLDTVGKWLDPLCKEH